MNAVDKYILICVYDLRDPSKQAIVASLIYSLTDRVLIWQVACEHLAGSRKLEPLGYNRRHACQYIRGLQRFWYAILPTWVFIGRAEELMTRFSLSHWNLMVVAACLESNVGTFIQKTLGIQPLMG